MSTPKKSFDNFSSPYSTPIQAYRSQSQDFLSLEIGGPNESKFSQGFNKRSSLTPPQHQNRNNFGNAGRDQPFYFDNRPNYNLNNDNSTGAGYNRGRGRGRFNQRSPDNYGQNARGGGYNSQHRGRGGGGGYNNRKRWSDGNADDRNQMSGTPFRGKPWQRNNHNNDEYSFEKYFHPSMLEDPWKDLMERLNAIEQSELQSSTEEDSKMEKDVEVENDDDDKDEDEDEDDNNDEDSSNVDEYEKMDSF